MKNVILLAVLIFTISCGPREGSPGLSSDMEDAKAKGVYIAEYEVLGGAIIVDNQKYDVRKTWVEHAWRYSSKGDQGISIIPEYYNLQVDFVASEILDRYKKDWTVGVETSLLFNKSGPHSIYAFIQSHVPDTVVVPIQEGIELTSANQTIIGEVTFVRTPASSTK
ncbi:hypothetical protein GGR27_001214 [Lewinella antarctica]|uniref:Uncharacterized protein n=2 Tax=Neolewinella antarctica TaxID=442734 RepID=A0ABX0X9M6_9BACT|nr:hypothetical protein [Neolewinella antarctica]